MICLIPRAPYLVLEVLLNMGLILVLRNCQLKLLTADGTLAATLIHVAVDVPLYLLQVLVAELHLTDGTVGHEAGLGEAVGRRSSRSQLWYGGPGGHGGQRGRANVLWLKRPW